MPKSKQNCKFVRESDTDILEEINNYSNSMKYSSDYINELFLYFYIKIVEKKRLLKINPRFCFEGSKALDTKVSLWQASAIKAGFKTTPMSNFFFNVKGFCLLMLSFLIVVIFSVLVPLYTMIKYRNLKSQKINLEQPFVAVMRAPATFDKMQFLKNDGVNFYTDGFSFNSKGAASLYKTIGFFKKLSSFFYVPIHSIIDFFKIFQEAKNIVGLGLSGFVLYFYIKRIAHKCNFEFYLNILLKSGCVRVYYTGNKEDRFALLEKRLCKKYGIKCVCIPHGLEYSYKMPGGLVGDDFYCTSLKAKNYLSKLYKRDSITFYFDEKIAERMFSRHIEDDKSRRIIFFPESREPEVNLKIMSFLINEGFDIFIKLHVKDSLENYRSIINKEQLINSFDIAISNNICLARKSTVLVEALYNRSVSISVLIDDRDKEYVDLIFPSLSDTRILRAESFESLGLLLTKFKGTKLDV